MTDIASVVSAKMAAATTPAPAAPEAKPAPKAEPKAEAKAEPKEPTAAEKKIWKLKVDGEEFDFDASDEEAVKKEIMKARGAGKRFETAAQMRKEAESFYEALKTDPVKVLSDPRFGHDVKKLAEEIVWKQMQDDALTPEQKRSRDIEAELKKFKDAEAASKLTAEQQQAKELQDHYEADYNNKIMSALEAGGVPKTKGTVRRMAYYLQQAITHNLDLTPTDLIAQVRKDYQDEHREMYASAEGDSLMALVGEELAAKIRKADLKRLKTTQPEEHRRPAGAKQAPRKPAAPERKLAGDEWRAELERKLLGR